MARSERFMEFIGAYVCQAVADTDAQVTFDVPTSETEQMALLVHRIDWEGNVPEGIVATNIGVDAYLTTTMSTPAGLASHFDHPSLIDAYMRVMKYGTTADDLLESDMQDQHRVHHFDPPILIAQRTLYLLVHSSNSAVVNDCAVRLGYTLEKVTQAAFIAALVAHH